MPEQSLVIAAIADLGARIDKSTAGLRESMDKLRDDHAEFRVAQEIKNTTFAEHRQIEDIKTTLREMAGQLFHLGEQQLSTEERAWVRREKQQAESRRITLRELVTTMVGLAAGTVIGGIILSATGFLSDILRATGH